MKSSKIFLASDCSKLFTGAVVEGVFSTRLPEFIHQPHTPFEHIYRIVQKVKIIRKLCLNGEVLNEIHLGYKTNGGAKHKPIIVLGAKI